MDIWDEIKKLTGYQSGNGGVDSYGVDHSGFSTRDELEYQSARLARENQLAEGFAKQGIAEENYPQYGTNFWGGSPENNYGFGTSNISQNIQNVTNQLNNSGFGNGTNNVTTSGLDVGKGFGTANQPQNPNDPNCYMTFDGQNLNLYNNTGQVGSLDAQSGHNDFQSAQYQNVANKGPLPQGTYYANQNQRQNITAFDAAAGIVGHGKWPGSVPAWGTKRVWLQPDANTNTYGRSGFTIHGDWSKGSAGCIDIPWQTGKLSNYLDDCQDSVPVYVKYPKKW